MAAFKRILFPTDFTEQCAKAAPCVAAFAKFFDAEILLLHSEVLPIEPYVWNSQPDLLARQLDSFAASHFEGLRVQQFLCMGDPAEQIVSYAHRKQADLIMMPTHGRGPFRRLVLGSVTTRVLHHTPCPVWTSAHLESGQQPKPPALANVLCAIDLDATGAHTLRYAGGLAQQLGASLTVAHAVPAVETLPEANLDREFQSDLIKTARIRLAQMQVDTGTAGPICVGAGNIAHFVAHAARMHNADLVITGKSGPGVLARLGTHDYPIIRECECPVLSV